MLNLRYSNEKGFSLIEMMIVVAVISLMAAVGIPQIDSTKTITVTGTGLGTLVALPPPGP